MCVFKMPSFFGIGDFSVSLKMYNELYLNVALPYILSYLNVTVLITYVYLFHASLKVFLFGCFGHIKSVASKMAHHKRATNVIEGTKIILRLIKIIG